MTEIWQEPPTGGYPDAAWLGVSGIERLRGGREGKVAFAPISYLTEMGFTELSEGHASFTLPASPWFANSADVIPGGILCMLADAPLGASIHSVLPAGVAFTTAELSMTMLRPVRPQAGSLIAGSGQVIHSGRSLALSEAFLFSEPAGDLVAHATSRCSVFPPIDPLPDPPDDPKPLDQPLPGSDPSHPLQRDPRGAPLPQEAFEEHGGLEIMRAQMAGEMPLPGLHHLTGVRVAGVAEGEVRCALPCSPWLSTSMGTVQGGFTAMLADFALTCSVFSTAEPGVAIAPVDLKVNFLRPVFPDMRELTATARVEHRGRTLAIASCRVENADGKPVALATGSSMYLPGRPANLAGVDQLGSDESAEDAAA